MRVFGKPRLLNVCWVPFLFVSFKTKLCFEPDLAVGAPEWGNLIVRT